MAQQGRKWRPLTRLVFSSIPSTKGRPGNRVYESTYLAARHKNSAVYRNEAGSVFVSFMPPGRSLPSSKTCTPALLLAQLLQNPRGAMKDAALSRAGAVRSAFETSFRHLGIPPGDALPIGSRRPHVGPCRPIHLDFFIRESWAGDDDDGVTNAPRHRDSSDALWRWCLC